MSEERSLRWLESDIRRQLSAKYAGAWPVSAWKTTAGNLEMNSLADW